MILIFKKKKLNYFLWSSNNRICVLEGGEAIKVELGNKYHGRERFTINHKERINIFLKQPNPVKFITSTMLQSYSCYNSRNKKAAGFKFIQHPFLKRCSSFIDRIILKLTKDVFLVRLINTLNSCFSSKRAPFY
jgi:hypothetical protein